MRLRDVDDGDLLDDGGASYSSDVIAAIGSVSIYGHHAI